MWQPRVEQVAPIVKPTVRVQPSNRVGTFAGNSEPLLLTASDKLRQDTLSHCDMSDMTAPLKLPGRTIALTVVTYAAKMTV